jgi:hypothetical protein
MNKTITIFKTFAEQEEHRLQREMATTPLQRLQNLFYMQQLSLKFRPLKNTRRTLVFHHGYTTP